MFVLSTLGWTILVASTGRGEETRVDFEKQIKPLLATHCVKCHGPEKQKGNLRLDTKADAFAPSESGKPSIVPHDAAGSLLVHLIESKNATERMPPKSESLQSEQIALLKRWIAEGAVWPDDARGQAPAKRQMVVTANDREHWAFAPLAADKPPATGNPIDVLVLRTLNERQEHLAKPIDRRREIRRLFYDLTGLPPAPEQVGQYEKATAPEAYQKLVDSLLGSSHYGERWAQIWLDAARYADSDGHEADRDRPNMWRYRDFVIQAANDNMPFDQFLRWQLAGDELSPDDPAALAATGFLATGPRAETQPTDLQENKDKVFYDNLDDVVSTTASAMLGLTVGCARCHDHKYDPVPTRDYYAMAAAFSTCEVDEFALSRPQRELDRFLNDQRRAWREQKMAALQIPEADRVLLRAKLNPNNSTQRRVYNQWDGKLAGDDAQLRVWMKPAEQQRLKDLEQRNHSHADAGKALAVLDRSASPATSWLLERGDVKHKAEEITLGFLQVLTHGKKPGEWLSEASTKHAGSGSTMQRAALAAWITDVEHGAGALAARVIVNRLWQQHFGEGLVRTPGDFGLQGQPPVHRELLDWLAAELIRSGWRLKAIQRLILTSAVYRQDSLTETGMDHKHPFARRPQRLSAELIRDAALAVSGELNTASGGPGFKAPVPKEAMSTRTQNPYPDHAEEGPALWRRSIYMFVKRSVRYPALEVFDAPERIASTARRSCTTVPPQQLTLLNDDFFRRRALSFAQRVLRESQEGPEAQMRMAFLLALGRSPSPTEEVSSLTFIARQTALSGSAEAALTDFCHALFTLNEFIYVD